MSLHPRDTKDLALAPVAVHIDMNLRPLRESGPEELEAAFQLLLNRPEIDHSRAAREERILEAALRGIDMHGWNAAVTADGSAVRLDGGSVSLDIALGATLLHHLEEAAAS
jgi:hypothetical protein